MEEGQERCAGTCGKLFHDFSLLPGVRPTFCGSARGTRKVIESIGEPADHQRNNRRSQELTD